MLTDALNATLYVKHVLDQRQVNANHVKMRSTYITRIHVHLDVKVITLEILRQ